MRRLSSVVTLLLTTVLAASSARAAVTLETSISDALGKTTHVSLQVVNTGDDDAIDIRPLVVFRGEEAEPDAVDLLVPGARYLWELDFPLADAAGAFPITAWIRYRDGYGETFSAPVVHLVGAPGYGGEEVALELEATPITEIGRVTARLKNPSAEAVAGRLVVLLPENLAIEPKSQPVEVPAAGAIDVPLVIQNTGAAEGSTHPIQVMFEYDGAGVHHTALGRTAGDVVAAGGGSMRALMAGALALLAALAALAFAWRRAARARQRASRAERRRERSGVPG
jgi:hypothetical protein